MITISGIYKIENVYNSKLYIGQSKNIYNRWYQHKSSLNNRRHHCRALQKDWLVFTETGFHFSIIEEASSKDLIDLEYEYLKRFPRDKLYNYKIEDHPWYKERTVLDFSFPVVHQKDDGGTLLPLRYCPSCQTYKLANSFSTSIYCLNCRTQQEEELEFETQLLEETFIPRYEKPVVKYKL
jgi:predicted GIY-YIG superfamily endonuclease